MILRFKKIDIDIQFVIHTKKTHYNFYSKSFKNQSVFKIIKPKLNMFMIKSLHVQQFHHVIRRFI